MAILELKAARGWSLAQAARAFLVEPETIAARLAAKMQRAATRAAQRSAASQSSTGRERDIRGVIVPADNAAEAAVVEGIDIVAVNFLSDAVGFLTDELPVEPTVVDLEKAFAVAGRYDVDFSDPEAHRDGQESAKRALTIAAPGHHNPDGHRESARRAAGRPCT